MIFFFNKDNIYYAVASDKKLLKNDNEKLIWLFGNAELIEETTVKGNFIGPRKEMITPWSTNAVEITQNMGIEGIRRIEQFRITSKNTLYDPMLEEIYNELNQSVFSINIKPEPIKYIENIAEYNTQEGLALSDEEIKYLEHVSKKLNRPLTDSEVFGFSQVNSEHCRHKIFNGIFIIDGKQMPESLFELIKKTTKSNPNYVVSAYKDNVAFIEGPEIEQFAPVRQDIPEYFIIKPVETVLSLKAETHNFPTTVEPFNGAATGSGGEIRDRMAGGKGSIPLAGTAVYMTSYPRLEDTRKWEQYTSPRKWLYQSPLQILIKASNGASDFGNKFGQPLICGSLLTFEYFDENRKFGYDKVIMLAGGIGYGKKADSKKAVPVKGNSIIVLGGDNYRIGMGGGAVSSVATGEYHSALELNAVQRSNPEMQKRVYNAIRAMAEADDNKIISIHDHGAGGHLNCLSELVEDKGGIIHMNKLPIGDPTLSAKEIIGNESQERMGLVIDKKNIDILKKIADRERAPFYEVGQITGDKHFSFVDDKGNKPIDLDLEYLFGKPPKTIINDKTVNNKNKELVYKTSLLSEYLEQVLQLEAVACKDWLTNKVDRSVTGKVSKQQTAGKIQLPLNDVAVMSLDYRGKEGIATAIGHAPVAGLLSPENGSILSIAEALTNLIWAPLKDNLKSVSLSANWMWPSKNEGEDSRLYRAVKAASDFCISVGINIPTGKDSLSMTQKYPDSTVVYSPGTVIISAIGEVTDITKTISPVILPIENSSLIYIDFSKDDKKLGGSSLSQILGNPGDLTPTISDPQYFVNAFNIIQKLIKNEKILAGHDISAGGIIVCLLEMLFADDETGMIIDLSSIKTDDIIKLLFSENPGIVIQIYDLDYVSKILKQNNINFNIIGNALNKRIFNLKHNNHEYNFDIDYLRDLWYKTSYLLDKHQTNPLLAEERYKNYKKQPLKYSFPANFSGKLSQYNLTLSRNEKTNIKAAIIREKGVNGDREMAFVMHLAGFDVKDVHMTDLISGRETLEDINFIVFVGGFSNSDVLGSAKGWAGAFLYNEKARHTLENFYKRPDTLSLGVCNGCQLMVELNLIYPEHNQRPVMKHNKSGKFESEFVGVKISENNSIMLKSLAGCELGIWIAHGEGCFSLPYSEEKYNIPLKYSYSGYPGNPNGSDYNTAAIVSNDGRHLAMMPHLERSFYPWHWPYYPLNRKNDEITPWLEAFVNARNWIIERIK